MLANSTHTYGLVAQALHWAIAVLILTLIPLGTYMHDLPAGTAAEAAAKSWFYSLHKTLGVTVLFLAIARIGWTITQPHPKPLNADRPMENLAAQAVHWTLYGAIIVMPISGWLHHSALDGFAPIWWPLPQDLPLVPKDNQLATMFGAVHFFAAILLGLSLALHIAGAMKHLFIDRDQTMARMIPFRRVDLPNELADPPRGRLPIVLVGLAYVAVVTAAVLYSALSSSNDRAASNVADAADATATQWVVDMQKSRLEIQFIQNGSPASGHFERWRADIEFDPEDVAAARANVEIDAASLDIGVVSEQARSADFLNTEQHPVATFVADRFVDTGSGNYEAHGQLTIVGQSTPIVLPFALRIESGRAFVEGRVSIERLAFGIGRQGFATDQMIGFNVDIVVAIEAEKPPTD